MPTILICDDEPAVRFAVEEALEALGADIVSVGGGAAALERLSEADVLVTDLVMPEMDGLELLAAVKKLDPDVPVVMLTARGNEKAAVAALKQGAYDYLAKPFGVDDLRTSVARALEARALRLAASELAIDRAVGRSIVGESPAFKRVLRDAQKVGRRDVTVLVRGETGTGKELIASVLHAASARRDGPCVRFNCAALAEGLAEAELFGHDKGAFTGALTSRPGYFRRADHGTLVLDEIAELPLAVQGKLLRALQEGEVQPVGAQRAERVDVRIVACTHRDLRAEVQAGRFREDLFYRVAVVELVVPPLRERVSDIPLLVEAFRLRWSARFDLDDARLSPALVAALSARAWPGNVRELENAVARLLALAEPGDEIGVDAMARLDGASASPQGQATGSLREQMATFERGLVARMLEATSGNQSEAARRLGVSRMTLIEKMKRHGLR
ncbi:MAG: sigma-54-dependent Fis family transcriptional regulator [Myxococcales bacterium]|nr:sigma-54-dependent Fis family transcriptional regulator [Myxococcales bacterium]